MLFDFSPQSILGLVAGEQDGIARIADIVLEMVKDPSAFAHSGSGDDHERTPKIVERLGLIHVSHIGEAVKTKGVALTVQECPRLLIKQFGVHSENLRNVHCQRAVNEDRKYGDCPSVYQLVQDEHQLLRSSDGKRRT